MSIHMQEHNALLDKVGWIGSKEEGRLGAHSGKPGSGVIVTRTILLWDL